MATALNTSLNLIPGIVEFLLTNWHTVLYHWNGFTEIVLHEEARVTAAVELKALEKLVKLNKIKLNAKSGMQFTLVMIMITLQLVTEVLDILSGVVIGICF